MASSYRAVPVRILRGFAREVFERCGICPADAAFTTDVLLTADLYGIESHGIQRLIRYFGAIRDGFIRPDAAPVVEWETPLSMTVDGSGTLGQTAARFGMETAIRKAKQTGFGIVTVHGSNHFGIAGYYTTMAEKQDLVGICMTNTEAIAIPTGGRKAMLGTSPIALAMPADPVPFWYDAATTVVTRGKLEVYAKNDEPLPTGWAADHRGRGATDAAEVIADIIARRGGGIFPLGGESESTGSHKGYGLGMIVELFTSVFSGGTSSPHVRNSGNGDTSFCFMALDYGMFGDKREIRSRMSRLLQEMRESPKADGADRIYTHGEKELESAARLAADGIPVNAKTREELVWIALQLGIDPPRFTEDE